MNKHKKGRLAEFLARLYLRLNGYKIIAKNYVTGRGTTAGEIDIVACRGKTLAFVEVKERKTIEKAAYAVHFRQKVRIKNAALFYLQKYPKYKDYNIRFDAVLVCPPLCVRHIANAWTD